MTEKKIFPKVLNSEAILVETGLFPSKFAPW